MPNMVVACYTVEGKEVWRQKLPALSYTPPLVAGARVFVLAGDRSVSGMSGNRAALIIAGAMASEMADDVGSLKDLQARLLGQAEPT